jgi:hypothetical protein
MPDTTRTARRIRIKTPGCQQIGRIGYVTGHNSFFVQVLLVKTPQEHAIDLARFSSPTADNYTLDIHDGKKAMVAWSEAEVVS